MHRKLMLMLTLAVLAAAAVAVAGDHEREMKVFAFADDEDGNYKVEVVQEDGVAKIKVWKVVDGEETLVKEYETTDGPGDVEVDGKRIVVLGDDMQSGADGRHVFVKRHGGGDTPFAWTGDVGGAYLGVQLSDLDEAKADYFDVKDGDGALVTEVVEESPAAAAGFKIYDVIVKLDDEKIADADEAVAYVRSHEAGNEVKVTIIRKGKQKTFTATLGERPHREFAFDGPRMERLHRYFPGQDLKRLQENDNKDIENLRADIEELRAMIEELKNNR